jgi:membrane protein implicated in regulation of membrane protease activity
MKKNLSIIFILGFIICLISIAITNIYLLMLAELVCFPVGIKLFILNLKNQN